MANVIRKRAVISRVATESVDRNDDLRDLYVFGYQCTLFRDDDKALYIEQGHHLIPWMGNNNLLIDRHDGRGHLHDLSDYDADLTRGLSVTLTEDEKQIEKLCDEERYLEMNADILEKRLYEEEELKRLNEALASDSAYSAVGFNYDSGQNDQQSNDHSTDACEDEDSRPYVLKPTLNLPSTIQPPKTEKIHAIIERTAAFTARHGIQMEIMIKAKQKDNPQFGFLNYEDELNAYYKHVVEYIKLGKFVPAANATSSSNGENNGSEANHSYLHPSLAASSTVVESEPEQISSQAFLESVSAKLPAGQIANTSYAKLLSNLSKHTRAMSPRPVVTESNSKATSSKTSTRHPPVPGSEPVTLPVASRNKKNVLEKTSSGTSSKSTEDLPVHGPTIIPPPPDIQPIIDKMADYVARNGPEFEFVVRRRRDERFRFLDVDHPHYAYYQHKKSVFQQEIEKKKADELPEPMLIETTAVESDVKVEDSVEKELCKEEEQVDEKDEKSISKAVSFSIKTKKKKVPTATLR